MAAELVTDEELIEEATKWLADGYGGEVQAGLIRRLADALSSALRQIADMQADHAETFAGKVVMSGEALTELQRTAQIGLDFASEVTRLRAEVESLTRERDMIAAQARAAVDAAQPAWASELSAPLRVGSELFPAGSKLSDVQEAINGVVGNNADWSAYDKGVREAGKAVVERWDTPLWKDVPATAIYIQALRSALRRVPASEAG